MLRFLLSLFLLNCMALAAAAPVPKDKGKTAFYHPTTVGTKWVLRLDRNERIREERHEVVKVEDRNGAKLVNIEVKGTTEDVILKYRMEVSPTGMYSVGETGRLGSCVLKLPPDPKTPWEIESPGRFGERRATRKLTARLPEEVTVPAGTYQAVRVVMEYDSATQPGKKLQTIRWYAPEVGLIKETSILGETVLKSFTAAKK